MNDRWYARSGICVKPPSLKKKSSKFLFLFNFLSMCCCDLVFYCLSVRIWVLDRWLGFRTWLLFRAPFFPLWLKRHFLLALTQKLLCKQFIEWLQLWVEESLAYSCAEHGGCPGDSWHFVYLCRIQRTLALSLGISLFIKTLSYLSRLKQENRVLEQGVAGRVPLTPQRKPKQTLEN